MGKIGVFNHLTLDGFFAGPKGEIDWFKFIKRDSEWDVYTLARAQSESTLMYGRTTYEMMRGFWTTPEAIKMFPDMARVVNHSPKIVFSRTLLSVEEGPNWKNITLLHDINPEEIRKLKEKQNMTILEAERNLRELSMSDKDDNTTRHYKDLYKAIENSDFDTLDSLLEDENGNR